MTGVSLLLMLLHFFCKARYAKRFGWDDHLLIVINEDRTVISRTCPARGTTPARFLISLPLCLSPQVAQPPTLTKGDRYPPRVRCKT
ncbi:hypothetical protein B0T24DRAFT_145158 [Lasiosphaeria ovina]|uniref:Secreted protein n=1 Tax=Lasiosphaeria ovina TaxID=92902 RepID=A0AAE0KMS9_9PEZI|nr:hypothetical protein B0T24DRAFT_145158 [Lasiosphaeria ovina]